MEKENKKGISKTVFILSLLLVFLIGAGGGAVLSFYLFNKYFGVRYEMPVTPMVVERGSGDIYEAIARRDILFHKPGTSESLWDYKYQAIPAGEGVIAGQIFINDQPAEGLSVSLILAEGRRTEKKTIGSDGKYRVSLPRGDYYFNGIALYNMQGMEDETILANAVAMREGENFGPIPVDNKEIIKEFEKLSEKFGKDEAAKLLSEKMKRSTSMGQKFPFTVGEMPYVMPDLHYRDAIRIVSPVKGTTVSSDNFRFIWSPSPAATFYKVDIDRLEKKGRTTTFHPVLTREGIKETSITFKELVALKPPEAGCSSEEEGKELKKGETYNISITAYNEAGKVITASARYGPDENSFKVE